MAQVGGFRPGSHVRHPAARLHARGEVAV